MMFHRRAWLRMLAMVLSVAIGGFLAAPAVAGGSDGPTPYAVTADGVTLPGATKFPASGHVNYKATKLNGTGEKSFGVHFDPNNKQPGGRFIGESFFGFTNYPATAQYGAITSSAASAFPDGYCVTWVQVSTYNEHFGEGGQKPVCTTPPSNGGNVDCPTGTTELAKYEWKGSSYVAEHGGQVVTVSGTTQSGTFTVVGNYTVSAVVVKGSTDSKVVSFNPAVKSGSFDNSGLQTPSGQTPAISNVKFCGNTTTPPPPTCVSTIDTKDVKAYYTTDPFHAKVEYTGKELCDGTTKTVSLNSYKTEGPTWETSGNQSFFDHDEFTITKGQTTGNLQVKEPSCYYQTDLYWGNTMFDGIDGALPHYPDTVTPTDLIDARNGGSGCTTPPTKIDIPATPSSNDPCGPNNATWNVPANTDTLNWAVNGAGHLIVTIVKDNTVFTDGTTKHDFGTVSDSGVACPPVDTDVTPTAPAFNDVCETKDDTYTIPSKAGVKYLVNGTEKAAGTYPGTGTVTITAQALPGYKIKGTDSWTFTYTNVACPVPPTKIDIPATPSSNDPCGPNNATWNVPANTDTLNWAVNGAGHLIVTIVKDNTVFTDGTTKHDFGTVSDSGVACPPVDVPAVPTAPSSGDECEPRKGSTNDWYTIPDDANFQYTWNGGLVAPGTYPANYKRYKFMAVPKPGIVLASGAADTWVERFTKKDCVKPKRVKAAVWQIDKCGTKADLFKAKKSRGIFYTVKGHEIREGVWLKAGGKRVVVKAHAASDRFKLKGKDKWVHRYSQKPCPPPPHNPPNTGQRVIGQ